MHDDGRDSCWRPSCASRGSSTRRSACWSAAAAICLGYTGQSLFLPNWFVRRRGLALSIAFSGVGVGSIILLPWLQALIARCRLARRVLGIGLRRAGRCWCRSTCCCGGAPRISGSRPTATPRRGRRRRRGTTERRRPRLGRDRLDLGARLAHGTLLVDRARLFLRALRLVRGAGAPDEIPDRDRLHCDRRRLGRSASSASSAIPGQIALGHLSDRIGREWVWTVGCLGFALCYVALLALPVRTNTDAALCRWSSRRARSAMASPR